ncbi:MAG: heme biosynthesis HemY N-terminal domain-containing protein [Wenzhouxiangellaceae bacterium]
MKRRLIWISALILIVAALLAGSWLGPRLAEDPGYVLIEIAGWRIHMALPILIVGVIALWLAIQLLFALFRLPGRGVRALRSRRRQQQLERGLLCLLEGDWVGAQKALDKSLRLGERSTVAYLAAARAAQSLGSDQRRDRYMALADERAGRRSFVARLFRARMLAQQGRLDEAIELLESLHLQKPRHVGVLRLLLQCYQDRQRWHELRLLVPALKRAGIVGAERARQLETLAAASELTAARDGAELVRIHAALSTRLKHSREVIAAFARRALELGRADLAEPELRRALSRELDDELLALYAQADEPDDQAARIGQLRRWLKANDGNAALHLALGRLLTATQQHEEARKHLERAVQIAPDAQSYLALAQLMDRLGELETATRCYRNALRLEQGRVPEPLPPPSSSSGSTSD